VCAFNFPSIFLHHLTAWPGHFAETAGETMIDDYNPAVLLANQANDQLSVDMWMDSGAQQHGR